MRDLGQCGGTDANVSQWTSAKHPFRAHAVPTAVPTGPPATLWQRQPAGAARSNPRHPTARGGWPGLHRVQDPAFSVVELLDRQGTGPMKFRQASELRRWIGPVGVG